MALKCGECLMNKAKFVELRADGTCPECQPCGNDSSASSTDTAGSDSESVPTTPPSSSAEPAAPTDGSATPTAFKVIKFTHKVRRGMALARMLLIWSVDDSKPPTQSIIDGWSKALQSDYNTFLAWAEQEEDWETVEAEWEKAGN